MTDFMKSINMEEDMAEDRHLWTALGCIDPIYMCRLNFAQRPIFSDLKFFNKSEISDS